MFTLFLVELNTRHPSLNISWAFFPCQIHNKNEIGLNKYRLEKHTNEILISRHLVSSWRNAIIFFLSTSDFGQTGMHVLHSTKTEELDFPLSLCSTSNKLLVYNLNFFFFLLLFKMTASRVDQIKITDIAQMSARAKKFPLKQFNRWPTQIQAPKHHHKHRLYKQLCSSIGEKNPGIAVVWKLSTSICHNITKQWANFGSFP